MASQGDEAHVASRNYQLAPLVMRKSDWSVLNVGSVTLRTLFFPNVFYGHQWIRETFRLRCQDIDINPNKRSAARLPSFLDFKTQGFY